MARKWAAPVICFRETEREILNGRALFSETSLVAARYFSLAIFMKSDGEMPVMRLNVTVKLLRELKPRLAAIASMVRWAD